jgi:ribosomal protein S4
MNIRHRIKKYELCKRVGQYPWTISKLCKTKRKKWAKLRLRNVFLKKRKRHMASRSRFFTFYKLRVKKLFKRFFCPLLNDRQCKKMLKSNIRYRATLANVLKLEYRVDILIYRLFMLSSINTTKILIEQGYFTLNDVILKNNKTIVKQGDKLQPSRIFWKTIYTSMLNVIASTIKYYNRLIFKLSYPFIPKKHFTNSFEVV